MSSIVTEWRELEAELTLFQTNHKEYVKKLEQVESMKKNYLAQFEKFKKKLASLKRDLSKQETTTPTPTTSDHELTSLKKRLDDNLNYMRQISDTFPRQNGLYLKVIIGGVCVSILNKEEKWKYKEEYEKFKYFVTMILMFCSFLLLVIRQYRVLDAVFNFIFVWYYCTLTIRESILVVNGSRITGWWLAHHFISCVCTAIILIWPDSESYGEFRNQFIWFSFYISFVQLLQYYYQKGCLYRLRALGEKQDMDTTVEGFQSWMTRGLSFLLPFLFFGYFWELYNAYTLFNLSKSPECNEWHALVLSIIFFILFIGNFFTSYMVIRRKLKDRIENNLNWLQYKYYDWKKLKSPSDHDNKLE